MAATLLVFLYTFLRLGAWHGFVRMLLGLWVTAQLVLVAVAFLDPRLAATFARLSSVAIAGVGAALTLFLALRGQDRALSLVPTWMLLLVWLFGAGVTFTGRLSGDIVVFGLTAGLVLIVVLIGFTVTQYAFRSFEPLYGAQPGEQQLRSLAVDGAGAAVWEWNVRRDEIKVSPVVEAMLGLKAGELSAKVDDFTKHMHPADRERFKLLLCVGEGAPRRRDAHRVPHAARRQLLPLVRARGGQRAHLRPPQPALRRPGARGDGRQARAGAPAARCRARQPHRPAQSRAVPRPPGDRRQARHARAAGAAGPAVHRHRQVQDRQHRVRPHRRRQPAADHRPAPRPQPRAAGHARPRRRRPVRAAAAQPVRCRASWPCWPSRCAARCARPSTSPARRSCSPPRSASPSTTAPTRTPPSCCARPRSPCIGPSARGPTGSRSSTPACAPRRTAAWRSRAICGAPSRRSSCASSISRSSICRPRRWPASRRCCAGSIRSLGTLNPTDFVPVAEESRPHRQARLLRAGQRRARGGALAEGAAAPRRPAVRQRQRLEPAAVPAGADQGGAPHPRPRRDPEGLAAARDHRIAGDGEPGEGDRGAAAARRRRAPAWRSTTSAPAIPRSPTSTSSPSTPSRSTARSCRRAARTAAGSVILRSVVALSHELGKKVVIEGVETEDDVGLLRSIGCEYGAGLLLRRADVRARGAAAPEGGAPGRAAHEQARAASCASGRRPDEAPAELLTAPSRGGPAPPRSATGAARPPTPAARAARRRGIGRRSEDVAGAARWKRHARRRTSAAAHHARPAEHGSRRGALEHACHRHPCVRDAA